MRIYRKSRTLRQTLNKKPTTVCEKKQCPIQNSKICNAQYCVYSAECSICQQSYIGSCIHSLHTRAQEHLTTKTSSIYLHKQTCINSSFKFTVLSRATDIVKLRFLESILIKRKQPQINNREETTELTHLISSFLLMSTNTKTLTHTHTYIHTPLSVMYTFSSPL